MGLKPMLTYRASYDTTTKVVSALVCITFLAIPAWTQNWYLGAFFALILVGSYAWSPRGYRIEDGCVVVARLIGEARIPLDGIREIRRSGGNDFDGCIRLFGNGGLFGYYGLFRTSRLGKCTWYVTNRANIVVLITESKTALFSPDEVEGFLSAIRETAPVPPTAEGMLASAAAGGLGAKLIGVVLTAIVIGVVAFAMLYSPGPPSLTLTPRSLAIHDRFYPVTVNASDVDVSAIRVIDLDTDKDWRPTIRTNGFANPHYRSGWFRVAGGKRVRMYRADGRRLVLLPPKSDAAPVLLETNAPDEFAHQLRQEWH